MAQGAAKWLDGSIAARRGVGWAGKPKLHRPDRGDAGQIPLHDRSLLRSGADRAPGDRIRIETRDAFEGAIRTERDKPTKRLRMPFVNPQNGPIMIERRRTRRRAGRAYRNACCRAARTRCGTCCMIPHFGALTGTTLTATLNRAAAGTDAQNPCR